MNLQQNELCACCPELKRKLDIAVKALEKYANPETHSMDETGFTWSGDYFDYDTAREALNDMRNNEAFRSATKVLLQKATESILKSEYENIIKGEPK